jgi:FkbH-like protein
MDDVVREKFSWIRTLNEARVDPKGLQRIKHKLGLKPLKGFELELIGRHLVNCEPNPEFASFRVAILSGFSSQPLANAMRVAALKEGFLAQVYEAPYGSIRPEILSLDSGLYSFNPQLILLDLGITALEHLPTHPIADTDVEQALDAELIGIQTLWRTLSERLSVPIVQSTLVAPAEILAGIADRKVLWSTSTYIHALNSRLLSSAPTFIRWLDLDALSKYVGLLNWHDPRLMHHAKYGFATKHLPDYMLWLAPTLREVLARVPKALIVDLDNTLWGGVIGDDGLDGIRLGPDSAEGSAYHSFCLYLLNLGQRGVILGLCSKNNIENVYEVFEKHPHMPLSLTDFAVIRCNWEDKATNLIDIAAELNIDPSALVFVDDNPAECDLIRQHLPQVHVVQMDGDPSTFVRCLDSLNLFHSQGFSREDLGRTLSYRARAQSAELQQISGDLESYLQSLNMTAKVEYATEAHLPRLAQMEMKTNQFNLSTRRLGLEQLREMVESNSHIVLAVSLADRFTDHGLVAYLAARIEVDSLRITDWLMSCRVFSRTLEQFTIEHLAREAKARGLGQITLTYVSTAKNGVMMRTFESIGFVCEGQNFSGSWVLQLTSNPIFPQFISPVA